MSTVLQAHDTIRESMIYTAGPSFSQKEIEYVTDAMQNCIDIRAWAYVFLLQEKMQRLTGTKLAKATSSCSGALHLIGWGLGIGPGDEVIVPDMTWIASTAFAVQLGAVPVYVDIEQDTWCISAEAIERAITPKTKAIVIVDMYGHPADMDPILDIARKHSITVIEDAAPAIGSWYKGKPCGSFGRAGAFSFHGAKAVAAGEGGAICSNDASLMERVGRIAEHGRVPGKNLYSNMWGCKYNMSNFQAAIACAQIDRLEELLAKKRQNFLWYMEELGNVDGLQWNTERPDCRANLSTIAVVLQRNFGIERDRVIEELKAAKIDSRPFFYPTSSLPMVNQNLSEQNPVSYFVAQNGLNMPNRHDLTREDIAYIAYHFKRILGLS
ncbi:DegT/DnrJ/EryC1/StrS family aminotransferase [Candidatus Peregrinibacteria bacterium]|nr:DegT/DnrJ/EryC1/StrS family aminotransferase [Candidatus Peregrinibacteria bacterium]